MLWVLAPAGALLLGVVIWTWWAELNPEEERELRVLVHEQLVEWFPEEMALTPGEFGFIPRAPEGADEAVTHASPDVVLLHGLDEPGGIWDELIPVLAEAGFVVWEFRYPNDQAIDRSTDLLAEHWPELAPEHPVMLVGHSMGGLVIRDFVTRWRHPEDQPPAVDGPAVGGAILVGTPNHGSEWVRLRMWLELRELLATAAQQRFSLFVGLREGTGAAKVDLRPGSAYLADINARPWPEDIPLKLVAGVLAEPTPEMREGIEAIAQEIGRGELADALEAWWTELGEGLGDGAVPVSSVMLPDAPAPVLVNASHRGMLITLPMTEGLPPAIPVIRETLEAWTAK
ncbi:MAG: alpha/beta hydrolase [Gammaproteobacteria bacterium]|nr:MAG: alpha/beta hydrolase [Gammaproteobacteria bacterium]